MDNPISLEQKLKKYFEMTAEAIKKVKIKSNLDSEEKSKAEDIFDLAKRYYEDAVYFDKKGEQVNAFGAVVYAHAFLDIGARLGFFDVDDSKLFMV